jgi:hypothetical protein
MDRLDVFYAELMKRAGKAKILARAAEGVRNFAKRQAHGFTGAYADQAARIGLNPDRVAEGITSLPGLARGLHRDPKGTLKAVGREAVSGGRAGLALGVGVPVALSAPGLAHGDESATGGRSMRRKLVGLGSGIAGGTLAAAVPAVPQLIGTTGLDVVSDRILGGRARRRRVQEAG